GRFPGPVSRVPNLTVHRALLPGPGSRFLYHSHSALTPLIQASYPCNLASPRTRLLGLGFVFKQLFSTGSSYRLPREQGPLDLTPAPHDTSHLHRTEPNFDCTSCRVVLVQPM